MMLVDNSTKMLRNVFRCTICSEGVPYNKIPRHGGSFKCAKCSQTRLDDYFGTDDANPGSIPLQLRHHMLTFVEEQLISLVCVNQYVYLRGKGGIATKDIVLISHKIFYK